MEDGIPRLVLLLVTLSFILCFFAISKNIAKTEKEDDRDMTYELNPFTRMKMPTNEGIKKKDDK